MDDKEVFEKRIGTVLRDKWTLERLLGVGGMAAVYVASHKTGRREAIKILHPDAARSHEMRARFEREAQAVNQLGHPGVVEIRDIDTTDEGSQFLVMELLEGEPLSDRAQRLGHIEVGEMLRLVDELLDVLAVAHAQGIIHRDIKLDNLFVQNNGRLKVLDFGIAHMRSEGLSAPRTRFGAKLGTAPYMPPEQVKGLPIDGRADIFAVGATMFRLVAKRRIHEAQTETEMLLLMATTPAPPLASVAPDAPAWVCLIVDRALAFEKHQRYPDADTMQGDVRAVRRGEAPPYATARLAAGDLPSAPVDSGVPAPSIDPFTDKPTVIQEKPDEAAKAEDARPEPPAQQPPSRVAPTLIMDPSGAGTPALPPSMLSTPSTPARASSPVLPTYSGASQSFPGASVTTVPPTTPMRGKGRRVSVAVVLALLVLVIAGAGLGWTLRGATASDKPPLRPTAAPPSPPTK
jgi:eukaryotic-like serine/threonine-protein kinase